MAANVRGLIPDGAREDALVPHLERLGEMISHYLAVRRGEERDLTGRGVRAILLGNLQIAAALMACISPVTGTFVNPAPE